MNITIYLAITSLLLSVAAFIASQKAINYAQEKGYCKHLELLILSLVVITMRATGVSNPNYYIMILIMYVLMAEATMTLDFYLIQTIKKLESLKKQKR